MNGAEEVGPSDPPRSHPRPEAATGRPSLEEEVTVTVCPDGPLLLRGPARLLSADGQTIDHQRRVLALCRCGRSRLKPLCDGSHRLNRFRDAAAAADLTHVLERATPAPDARG